jgi:hypothetical protein
MNYQEYNEYVEELYFAELNRNEDLTLNEVYSLVENTEIHDMEQYLLNKGYNLRKK